MNVLVTGGASGLGKEITIQTAQEKNNFVYFTYCKSKKEAELLEKNYPNVKSLYCDFKDRDSLQSLLKSMEDFQLHALVNNAITELETKHFHKIDSSKILSSFENNLLPFIQVTQKSIEIFRKSKFGKIITILSSAIINKPPIGWSIYVAEKNYILSICESIALENASFNITSNSISPGFMLTGLTNQTDNRVVEDMISKHPLKKLLTTKETAQAVLFFLNSTQQINGVNMPINAASDFL